MAGGITGQGVALNERQIPEPQRSPSPRIRPKTAHNKSPSNYTAGIISS